jgi:hypothetical protein
LYQEEFFAKITATVREQVKQLQAGGEPHPVIFHATAEDEQGRRLLAQLGYPDSKPGEPTPLVVLTRERTRELLNTHVSPGLGTKLMGVSVESEHGLWLLSVSPGRVDSHVLVFEDDQFYRRASFFLDVRTRVLRLNTEGDQWDTIRIDW